MNQGMEDFPVDISQAPVNAVMADGELLVVDSQLVKDGGVDIVDSGWMVAIKWFVSPVVTGPV